MGWMCCELWCALFLLYNTNYPSRKENGISSTSTLSKNESNFSFERHLNWNESISWTQKFQIFKCFTNYILTNIIRLLAIFDRLLWFDSISNQVLKTKFSHSRELKLKAKLSPLEEIKVEMRASYGFYFLSLLLRKKGKKKKREGKMEEQNFRLIVATEGIKYV